MQYEGLESSPNIFYTGATTNQQIIPAWTTCKEKGKKKIFLVGSDYVFPRTANKIIKAYAAANGMEIVGEEYTPLGAHRVQHHVNKIVAAKPDAVFNTLNGDSNVAFFKQLNERRDHRRRRCPIISVSVAEEEVKGIGADNIAGHSVAWNYYQTTETPGEQEVRRRVQGQVRRRQGDLRPDGGRIQRGLPLGRRRSRRPGPWTSRPSRTAAGGIAIDAPEGMVTIDGENQHIYKTARIGVIQPDGLIKEVWNSGKPIKPDPYLKGYAWASGLSNG